MSILSMSKKWKRVLCAVNVVVNVQGGWSISILCFADQLVAVHKERLLENKKNNITPLTNYRTQRK